VDCSSAPAGTAIQDEEYKYDNCNAPDVPSGFACNNALGRLTIARAVLQCGSSQTEVKRGRWYDYDAAARVARVAYATVTGSTIGTPAIMTNSYTAAGRLSSATSPINASFGTSYTYGLANGRVKEIKTTEATPSDIAATSSFYAFGPVRALTTPVTDGTRTLVQSLTRKLDGSLDVLDWRLDGGTPISLVNQTFLQTEAGLIAERRDAADRESARFYRYDSLLRMDCEARGKSSPPTYPTSANCVTSDPLLAGLHTFGNGQSATSPPDVRLTSFTRAQGASYVSPSVETSTYSSGSARVTGITRSTSSMVIGYDDLGRRTFENESFDSTRSKRSYTYLPNGQLGSISGRTSSNVRVSASILYDERGRPSTIAEYVDFVLADSYELFWDDADRLVAVNIIFATPRACGYRWSTSPRLLVGWQCIARMLVGIITISATR
jgi:hypothetical protein